MITNIIMEIKKYISAFLLLIIAITFIVFGDKTHNQYLLIFGSSILGGVFSIIISVHNNIQNLNLIKKTIQPDIRGEEQDISSFRTKLYEYRITIMDSRKLRCSIIDFGKINIPNMLYSEQKISNLKAKFTTYKTKATVIKNRMFIFTYQDNSSEPICISIFPNILEGYKSHYVGIRFSRNWRGRDSLSPTILTKTPWNKINRNQLIDDEEIIKEFDLLVKEGYDTFDIDKLFTKEN